MEETDLGARKKIYSSCFKRKRYLEKKYIVLHRDILVLTLLFSSYRKMKFNIQEVDDI